MTMEIDFESARRIMVQQQIAARGIKDKRVLSAMLKVPRHLFVPEELRHQAYEDHPLPIGENQTISQPYIVALMTEALRLNGDEKVLEIGTGSGYQTAILAELAKEVYTVERIASLSERAREILNSLGYKNIHFKVGDGTKGWEEFAPYQAIIVTAAAKFIPEAYIKQLDTYGRLVIPVEEGGIFSFQDLKKIVKNPDGSISEYSLGGCRFVPLIGEY